MFSAAILTVFGLLFSYMVYSSEITRAQTVTKRTNDAMVYFVEGYFTEIINTIQVLRDNEDIRNAPNLDEASHQNVLGIFRSFSEANANITYIYSGYENGLMLINDWVAPAGFDPTARPWYQAAMKTAPEISIGLPYQEINTGEWLISTSKALPDEDGAYGGVVAIDCSIEKIAALLKQHEEYETAYSYIVDGSGTIILHHDESLLGVSLPEIVRAVGQSEYGQFSYALEGIEKLAHFSTATTTGWTVVTVVEKQEIILPLAWRVAGAVALVAFMAILLGLFQSTYMGRRFSRPLDELSRRIKTLVDGEEYPEQDYPYPHNQIGLMAREIGLLAETELLAKNRALRENNLHLDMFFNQSLTGFSFMTLDEPIAWNNETDKEKALDYALECQRITRINQAMLDQYGAKEEDFLGMTFADMFRHDLDRGRQILHDLFDRGRVKVETNEHRFDDGAPIVINGDYTCLYDHRGDIIGHFGVQNDITASKNAEEALRKSERRYRVIIESIQDGYFEVDLAGRFTFFNNALCHIHGYPPQELAGMHYRQFTDEENAGGLFESFNDVYRTGKGGEIFEYQIIQKDGSRRTIEVSASIIKDEADRPVGFRGITRDITERKRLEDTVRESEAKYRTILEEMEDAYMELDLAGTIQFVNEPVFQHTGYGRDEIAGTNFRQHALPEYHETLFEAYGRVFRTGKPERGIFFEFRRKDGTTLFAEHSVFPLYNRENEIVGFRGITRDITERKKGEEALLESNRRLEEATIRANELAIQAERANIAKGEFLANMSHEIRTPMNGVIGMTGLLLETELSDEQRHYAEIVRTSGESLLGVINDILDFSKIEAGKLDLEILDFDLQSFLEDFAATVAVNAHAKGLELICAADPSVPTLLKGDPGRLRQLLSNLAGNAVKFTSEGEVAIGVSLVEERDDDVFLRFTVRDTGIGIPADKLDILFEKFTQVDASTTRQYGGTGLGLAISKQLAEIMGGEMGVESQEGRGSEFWFTLRLGKQDRSQPVETPLPVDLNDIRVLVVDDNSANREILVKRLSLWGMRPVEVDRGSAALRELHRAEGDGDPFQLVIIDMQMPEMDGAELGREIRKDSRYSSVPLVMLTSLGVRGDARRFKELGFSGYATKPIRHEEFQGVLSQVLAGDDACDIITTRHRVREVARSNLPDYTGKNLRILLAEDNLTNQQVATGILGKLGLSVHIASNGIEALEALDRSAYDLVFMDVQMPEMNGIEATQRIRERMSPNWRVPVIAMTAHAMRDDRERFLMKGMNDYIAKPITPQTVAQVLEKWLPGTEPERKDGSSESAAEEDGPDSLVPTFDRTELLDRLMGDEELARKVIDGFLKDIPRQIGALRDFLSRGETGRAGDQAHQIKGAAAGISAVALSHIARDMESAGREGNRNRLTGLMDELEQAFETLQEELK